VVTYFNTLSQHDNYQGPVGTNFNFGPHRLIPCVKMLRVEAQIQISAPLQSVAPTSLLPHPFTWGVQFGLEGYTPADLVSDAFAPNYLWTKLVGGNGTNHPVWAPGTTTGVAAVAATASWIWRAQMPVNQNTDLYVSVINNLPSPAPIVVKALLRVLSTALPAGRTRRAGAASGRPVCRGTQIRLSVWPVNQSSPCG
jgi:hypothetical protein